MGGDPSVERSKQGTGVAAAITAALILALAWNPPHGNQVVIDLAIGLFGALLTALTFILALTIDAQSPWPSLRRLISYSLLGPWFLLSALSVVAAVASAFAGRAADGHLAAAAVALAAMGAVVGILAVGRLLDASGGRGRRRFLSRSLAEYVHRAELSDPTDGSWPQRTEGIAEFLDSVVLAVDRASVPEVRNRIEELVLIEPASVPAATRGLIQIELRVIEILGSALVTGRLASSASPLLFELFDDLVQTSGYLLSPPQGKRTREDEVDAAVILGHASRVAAWLHKSAFAQAQTENADHRSLARMMDATQRARQRIRTAADPDPPGVYIPPHDPWARGLSDPEATFQWLWGYTDFDGTGQGEGLYVLCETLTGAKFFGSYGEGDSVLHTIDERLARSPGGEAREASEKFLATVGGLESVALELCANSIGAFKDRTWEPPAAMEAQGYVSQDDQYLASRLRLFRFVRNGKTPSVEEGLGWLARLLGSGQGGPRLWKQVEAQYRRLGLTGRLPVVASSERPAASVLAVAMKMFPEDEEASVDSVRAFLDALSDPLVFHAHTFASRILCRDPTTKSGGSGQVTKNEAIDAIIDHLGVLHGY